MKRLLFSLLFAASAFGLELAVDYTPQTGAFVTIPDVGPGFLEVQRSTDLKNWTTFAIASMPSHIGFTNTWRFHDYLSVSNPVAFYRANYTATVVPTCTCVDRHKKPHKNCHGTKK